MSLFFGDTPVVTPDGKRVLYWKTNEFGIFARSLDGDPGKNREERIVDDYIGQNGGFLPVPGGLYCPSFTRERRPLAFRFFDYAEHRSKDIAPAPRQLSQGLTVSPDERRLLFAGTYAESGQDLLLFEFQ